MGQLSAPNFSKEINLLFWALGQFQEVMRQCVCGGGGSPTCMYEQLSSLILRRKDKQALLFPAKKLKLRNKKLRHFFCTCATKNTDGRANLCRVKLASNLNSRLPPHSWMVCFYYYRKQQHFSSHLTA